MDYSKITDDEYRSLKQAALDVQYLMVKIRGMATKSGVEDYMMTRFGLDRYFWHRMLNSFEYENIRTFVVYNGKVSWNQAYMLRSEPKVEQYPGIEIE